MLQVDVTELRSPTSWTWSATSPTYASPLTHTVEASPAELGALHNLQLSGDAHLPSATIAWARETLLGDDLAEALESGGAATINLQGPYQAQLAALPLSAGLAPHVALSYRCGTATHRVLPEHPRILYIGISPIDQSPLDLLTDRNNYIDAWSTVDCTIHTLVGHVSQPGLAAKLQEGWDVLHLTCHSAPGSILVEDEVGYSSPMTADELASALPDTLSLITLAACAGSQSSPASIARRTRARLNEPSPLNQLPSDLAGLVAQHSNATVLATRQEITDVAAQRLFPRAITQIVAGASPADALTAIDASRREALNMICWHGLDSVAPRIHAGTPKLTANPIDTSSRPDGHEIRLQLLRAASTPAELAAATAIANHVLPAREMVSWVADLIAKGRALPVLDTLRRHHGSWDSLARLGPEAKTAVDELRTEVDGLPSPHREMLDLITALPRADRGTTTLEVAITALGHNPATILDDLHSRRLIWPDSVRHHWATSTPSPAAIQPERWRAVHQALSAHWATVVDATPGDAHAWLSSAHHLSRAGDEAASHRSLVNASLGRRTLGPGQLLAAIESQPDSPATRLAQVLTDSDHAPERALNALGVLVEELANGGARELAEIAAAERVDLAFRFGHDDFAAAIEQYQAHMSRSEFSRLRLGYYRLRSEVRSNPAPDTAARLDAVAAEAAALHATAPAEALRAASLAEALWDLGDDLARAAGDWGTALELTGKIAESRETRTAPPVERADALLNQYGPLLMLDEVNAAALRLRQARQAFEAAEDAGGITRVLAAQAQVAHRRGQTDIALDHAMEAAAVAGDPVAAAAAHATIARWSTPDPRAATAAAQHHVLFAAVVFATVRSSQSVVALEDLAQLGLAPASAVTEVIAGLSPETAEGAQRLITRLGHDRLDATLAQIRDAFEPATLEGPDLMPLTNALAAGHSDPLLADLVSNYLTSARPPFLTDDVLSHMLDQASNLAIDPREVDHFVADLVPVSLARVVAVMCERSVVGLDDRDVRASLQIAAEGGHRAALAASLLASLDGVREPSRLLDGLATTHAAAVVRAVRVLDGVTPIEHVAPTDAQLAAMADQARIQAAVAVYAARTGPTEALEAENLLARLAADPDTAALAATLASLLDDSPPPAYT